MTCVMCRNGLTALCQTGSCDSSPQSLVPESDPSLTLDESDEKALAESTSGASKLSRQRRGSNENLSRRHSSKNDSEPSNDGTNEYSSESSESLENIRGTRSLRTHRKGRSVEARNTGRRDTKLKDQQSTGRKRAAKLYPLNPESACEWQNRIKCGGGRYPIRGCLQGKQQARHHGPDKSVVNNELGNVHRICHYCHNRWHALNDKEYNWNNPDVTPHSPEPMPESIIGDAVLDEMRYMSTKHKKVRD